MSDIRTLDDIELTELQRKEVLEWYAWKIWRGLEEGSGDPYYYGKSYDPLTINRDDHIAHSYVFNFEDGGRHHAYRDLAHLEEMLDKELITGISDMRESK